MMNKLKNLTEECRDHMNKELCSRELNETLQEALSFISARELDEFTSALIEFQKGSVSAKITNVKCATTESTIRLML